MRHIAFNPIRKKYEVIDSTDELHDGQTVIRQYHSQRCGWVCIPGDDYFVVRNGAFVAA